ncbi:Uncharacterised protein [Mycobacteroides abscessus subsp. massiliense]|uniref:hypothetical protein n=1 Tax=Mycobacteroides abscessus TaxID=36809 RepID=UPI0009A85A37|nr:hypothetical protein [Mycobacteroides abscessus]SLH95705.1 Uncharacterised protein [Mycobacteroides abscessus subsp. massiliense]SLI84401.1 Uncharacterised protein [Mycobacteroides abscessus subsp. massiliense]
MWGETQQRINRANAEAGGIVFLPDDWRDDIEPLADAFGSFDSRFRVALPYDDERIARRIAGHMVGRHVTTASRNRSVDLRWCPSHDEELPETMAHMYVLTYANIDFVIPLRKVEQYKEIAPKIKRSRCEAQITRRCEPNRASRFLAVTRGEYICLFNTCRACLQHIDSRAGFNKDYCGPDDDWFDDGKRRGEPVDW